MRRADANAKGDGTPPSVVFHSVPCEGVAALAA